ncbi:MAG: glycoside hydrolase family 127 protein [Opitutaceae bacterium]|nr:glycoside hydrolase family 127 protein [Opitutaceae bacterium]
MGKAASLGEVARRAAVSVFTVSRPIGLIAAVWSAGAASAREQTLPLVGEKITPAIADRQDAQIPDRLKLTGWIGSRIHVNDVNRLAKLDTDRLLEGYRKRPGRQTWDGEHVGKWLHAATLAWAHRGNPELRRKLDHVVTELAKCQLADGYLGTYVEAARWTAWDVWAHKYNLLGLITYMRHTGNLAPMSTCRRMADLLCQTFGDEPGQRDILVAGHHAGMAPTSVLEPMALLYRLTGEPRYLEFCRYILRSWEKPTGPRIVSTLLRSKRVDLVGNAKAYEMLSCLNGALEYHRTVTDKRILEAALNAWHDIVEKRLYLTGTASYQEFFHADFDLPNVNHVGETCVTVTWLQFNAQLLRLTGEARFAEQIERTVLNQLFGAQCPDGSGWGYYVEMQGKKPYTSVLDGQCCLSSGPRGVSLIPTFAVSTDADGVVVNLYDAGAAKLRLRDGTAVTATIETHYPSEGRIRIAVAPAETGKFAVKLRIPEWCQEPVVQINGQAVPVKIGTDGYAAIRREWKSGDGIELNLELKPRVIVGDFKNEGKLAVLYGPLVLAADEALVGRAGLTLDAVGVAGADLAVLGVKPRPVPDGLKTWPVAPTFQLNAVVRKPAASLPAGAPLRIGLVPFADAGAKGSSYRVWLPYGTVRPSRNLLFGGVETRSRRPQVRVRSEDPVLANRPAGSVVDEFQTVAHTFDRKRAREDWYAVALEEPATVAEVVFFHGEAAPDGGWFDASAGKPRVEIKSRPNGEWEPAGELEDYPATTASDPARLVGGDRFACRFRQPMELVAVRVVGRPASGNNPKQAWSSCLELQAFGVRRLTY